MYCSHISLNIFVICETSLSIIEHVMVHEVVKVKEPWCYKELKWNQYLDMADIQNLIFSFPAVIHHFFVGFCLFRSVWPRVSFDDWCTSTVADFRSEKGCLAFEKFFFGKGILLCNIYWITRNMDFLNL